MLTKHHSISAIVTTGEKATETLAQIFGTTIPSMGKHIKFEFHGRTITHYRAPSSSRAYPLSLDKKAEAYAQIFIAEGYNISKKNA